MPLTLTLREPPTVPLETEGLSPDRLAGRSRGEIGALTVWHGNGRAQLADFFTVSGNGDEDLRVEGDLRGVKFLGTGMDEGRLIVAGAAGMHTGAGMRGGELIVEGDVGDFAGVGMLAGTIVALGELGAAPGAAMRRGTIVAMSQIALLPTFGFACSYHPPFLRLYLRRLRGLGLALTEEQIEGRYARWSGDGLELRRGEILIYEGGR